MQVLIDLDRAIRDARLAQARAELAMIEARFKVRAVIERRHAIARDCEASRRTLALGEPANDHA